MQRMSAQRFVEKLRECNYRSAAQASAFECFFGDADLRPFLELVLSQTGPSDVVSDDCQRSFKELDATRVLDGDALRSALAAKREEEEQLQAKIESQRTRLAELDTSSTMAESESKALEIAVEELRKQKTRMEEVDARIPEVLRVRKRDWKVAESKLKDQSAEIDDALKRCDVKQRELLTRIRSSTVVEFDLDAAVAEEERFLEELIALASASCSSDLNLPFVSELLSTREMSALNVEFNNTNKLLALASRRSVLSQVNADACEACVHEVSSTKFDEMPEVTSSLLNELRHTRAVLDEKTKQVVEQKVGTIVSDVCAAQRLDVEHAVVDAKLLKLGCDVDVLRKLEVMLDSQSNRLGAITALVKHEQQQVDDAVRAAAALNGCAREQTAALERERKAVESSFAACSRPYNRDSRARTRPTNCPDQVERTLAALGQNLNVLAETNRLLRELAVTSRGVSTVSAELECRLDDVTAQVGKLVDAHRAKVPS